MILIRTDQHGLAFQLGSREKQLLLDVVQLYPLVPASHHRLSQANQSAKPDENQRLLDEALAEQRAENRRQVQALLAAPRRFRATKSGVEFRLAHGEVDWLLQVLNDVRVGGWLALGEPEPGEVPKVTEQNVKHHFAMEASGLFESALLAALGVSESPQWAGD
jgi:hypothetical protein